MAPILFMDCDPEHDREASDLGAQGLAGGRRHRSDVLHLRSDASLRSVLWVASDLSRLISLPALDADYKKSELARGLAHLVDIGESCSTQYSASDWRRKLASTKRRSPGTPAAQDDRPGIASRGQETTPVRPLGWTPRFLRARPRTHKDQGIAAPARRHPAPCRFGLRY